MNPISNEVAAALTRLMERHPDWRIGQAVANVATWTRGVDTGDVWEMENAEFVAAVDAHLAVSSKREPAVSSR